MNTEALNTVKKEDRARRRGIIAREVARRVEAGDIPPELQSSAEDWAGTPESVRLNVWRRMLELRHGRAKSLGRQSEEWFQDDVAAEIQQEFDAERVYVAQVIAEVEPYRKLAEASGTTLPEVLRRYADMENMLRQNSVMGTLHIWRNCGVDPAVMLQSIAQHLAALDGRGPWQQ